MQDISGYGLQILLIANTTFPNGVLLTQFADDGDPFDVPSIKVGDTAMGLNGELIVWRTANPIDVTINLIPGSDNDIELMILLEANRTVLGSQPARDVITLVSVYPDGRTYTLSEGVVTDGPPGLSVASAGRFKTNAYMFRFQDKAIS